MPRVLAGYDAAIAEARRLARGQRDLIRVGYLGSTAQMFLDPALSVMRHSHPGVKVKLLDLSPGEQIAVKPAAATFCAKNMPRKVRNSSGL